VTVAPGVALGILAGGRGERFGGRDKGWVEVGGVAQVRRVMAAASPQAAATLVSANRHLDDYAALGVRVVPDTMAGHPGPLAGIAALLAACDAPWLLTVPVDALCLPRDYARRMLAARDGTGFHVVVAEDDDGLQPLFALYPAALAAHARETLDGGRRSVREWQHRFPVYPCRFDGIRFGNLNSPDDLPPP
jgi:molybdopterin-guanine dinucleotide biosynthesis protein A